MASAEAGSDDITELLCQPCVDDGENLPAEGYCTICQEYLCTTCVTHHGKVRLSRNHVILDKFQMPKIRPSKTTIDMRPEQCTQHFGEIISFYCKSDDQFGCQKCAKTCHLGCVLSELSDVSEGIAQSEEYRELTKELSGLEQRFDRMLSLSKTYVEEINTNHSKTIAEIEMIRDDNLKTMGSVLDTCNAVVSEIQTIMTKLETLQQTNQNGQMFVVMRNAAHHAQTFENCLSKVEAKNTIRRYSIALNEKSGSLKNVFGQLQVLPSHIADIDVKSSTDLTTCYITGSCLHPNNQLVIADNNNFKVKLVDITQDKVMSEIELLSNPFDVTMIDTSQVAVTLTFTNTIQLLSTTSASLSKGREIKANGQCLGVEYNDGILIVTFQNPGKVEMMDMNGTVLRSLMKNVRGVQLFDCPAYVAVSPDKSSVYISDCYVNTVMCMAMDGTVKAVVKDVNMKNTRGLAISTAGSAYICGMDSNNVHQIATDGTKMRILLGRARGLTGPCSVTLSDRRDKLYIGMKGNVVKVFQIN